MDGLTFFLALVSSPSHRRERLCVISLEGKVGGVVVFKEESWGKFFFAPDFPFPGRKGEKEEDSFCSSKAFFEVILPPSPLLANPPPLQHQGKKENAIFGPLVRMGNRGMGLGFFGEKRRRRRVFGIGSRTLLFFAPTTNHALRAITPFSPQSLSVVPRKPDFFLFWFAKSLCSSTHFFLTVSSHLELRLYQSRQCLLVKFLLPIDSPKKCF